MRIVETHPLMQMLGGPKYRIEDPPPGHCPWGEATCDEKCEDYRGCKLDDVDYGRDE